MINSDSLYIARTLFKLKVHKCNGLAYQDLFTQVMQHKYQNFKQIKPQGNIGDRKNDGYRKDEGIFYQVYAPENPDNKDVSASTKALKDFEILFTFWSSIESVLKYFFVFNDKYLGEYPLTRQKLSEIEKKYTDVGCDLFVAKHLEEEFLLLDELDIIDVVGNLPSSESIGLLGYDCLSEVINFLLRQPRDIEQIKNLVVPDIGNKITFNNLTPIVSGLLQSGQLQAYSLEDYFRNHPSKSIRQDLQQVFILFYEDLKKKYADASLENNDVIFFDILQQACGTKPENREIQNAVLVLMAYYFEHCDIFEEPPKS